MQRVPGVDGRGVARVAPHDPLLLDDVRVVVAREHELLLQPGECLRVERLQVLDRLVVLLVVRAGLVGAGNLGTDEIVGAAHDVAQAEAATLRSADRLAGGLLQRLALRVGLSQPLQRLLELLLVLGLLGRQLVGRTDRPADLYPQVRVRLGDIEAEARAVQDRGERRALVDELRHAGVVDGRRRRVAAERDLVDRVDPGAGRSLRARAGRRCRLHLARLQGPVRVLRLLASNGLLGRVVQRRVLRRRAQHLGVLVGELVVGLVVPDLLAHLDGEPVRVGLVLVHQMGLAAAAVRGAHPQAHRRITHRGDVEVRELVHAGLARDRALLHVLMDGLHHLRLVLGQPFAVRERRVLLLQLRAGRGRCLRVGAVSH